MEHSKSDLAGQKVKIKSHVKHLQDPHFGGSTFIVEDWWDRVTGRSWMICDGNPACLVYALRTVGTQVPLDNEVLYGHSEGGLGHLVHISEIDIPKKERSKT